MSAQPNTLERFPIFLATPSDLSAERRIFYEVIEKVNIIKAKSMGILLEAKGWENTLPGKGRPQEMINQDLKISRLVVMLLWKRWGSPTGIYSSGFEEEFEEAHADGKNILFYFREISSNMLMEPDEQLKKVLDFKTRIKDEKKYLYKEYKDEKDWNDTFLNNLCLWLDQMRSRESQATIPSLQNNFQNSHDIDSLSSAEKIRFMDIIKGVIQDPDFLTPNVHAEFWALIDKVGPISTSEVQERRDMTTGVVTIYQRYFHEDALWALKTGHPFKSLERERYEKHLLDLGVMTEWRIKENEALMAKIAVRELIPYQGTTIVYNEDIIYEILANLEAAGKRLDTLFTKLGVHGV